MLPLILDSVSIVEFLLRNTFYALIFMLMHRVSGYAVDAHGSEYKRNATPLRDVSNTTVPVPPKRSGTKGYDVLVQTMAERRYSAIQSKMSPRATFGEEIDSASGSTRGNNLDSPRTSSRAVPQALHARCLPLRDPTSPNLSYLPPGHTAARLRARKEAREGGGGSATSSPRVGYAGLEREVRVRSHTSTPLGQGRLAGSKRVHAHVKGLFDFDVGGLGDGDGGTFEGDLELFIQDSPVARTSTPNHMRRFKAGASENDFNRKLSGSMKLGGLAQVFKLRTEEAEAERDLDRDAIRLGGPFVPIHVRNSSDSIFSSMDAEQELLEHEFEESLSLSSGVPSSGSFGSMAVQDVLHTQLERTEEDVLLLRLACASLELGQIEADLSLVDSNVGIIEARLAEVKKEVYEVKDRSMDSDSFRLQISF